MKNRRSIYIYDISSLRVNLWFDEESLFGSNLKMILAILKETVRTEISGIRELKKCYQLRMMICLKIATIVVRIASVSC